MATDMGRLENKETIILHIKRHFKGIHHRFVNDPEFRESQLEHARTEEV